MNKKQILGTLILSGYFLSWILSIFGNFQRDTVDAFRKAENTTPSKLIAVLVDQKTEKAGIPGLKRYTTQYLPQKYSNSKILALSINTDEYTPLEIQKLLENLYFEGEKDQPSELIGVILVGEIPLPVVKYNDFLFPSIYPYVDFLDQKYLWDQEKQYFVNDKNSGQAEIRHGVINFKNDVGAYENFFEKLRKYDKNPQNFIEKKIRYDDFIALQNNFLEENYKLYENKLTFAEDIAYNRYNDLFVNTLQSENEKEKAELLKGLSTDGENPSNYDPSKTKTPTKFQQEKLKALAKNYISSISFPLQRAINENIQAAGRREKAENHYQKLELKDQLNIGGEEIQGLLREINDKLENFVDQKIKQEKYAMNAVIPTFFANEKKYSKRIFFIRRLLPEFNNAFKFFYFGKDAELLNNAQDASIYRGTFRNLDQFGKYSTIINDSQNPAKTKEDKTDLKNKSLGASYDAFSQQTEGNRGFNMLNTPAEYKLYNKEKTHKEVKYHCTRRRFGLKRNRVPCSRVERKPVGKCNPNAKKLVYNKEKQTNEIQPNYEEMADCENFAEFGKRIRGGATPLNATGINDNNYHFEGEYDPKSAWKRIFDIAGSIKTKKAEPFAHSFLALTHYLSPTQILRKEGAIKDPIYHNLNAPYNNSKSEIPVVDDYFKVPLNNNILAKDGYKKFKIIKPKTHDTDEYREYRFKTIDTIVEHKSSTANEINGRKGKKYDEQSENYNYYQQLLKSIQIKEEDKFSAPLLAQFKQGQEKLNEIKRKIENITEAPENNTINEQDLSDFSTLFNQSKENFENHLNLINKDYSADFNNQIEIIKNQQIEKNPKIGLLSERYQKLNEQIQKLENFYSNADIQAAAVFDEYNNLYQIRDNIATTINGKQKNLEQKLQSPTITPEESSKIQKNIQKRNQLKNKISPLKETLDNLNQTSECESYHENLGGLLGKKNDEIKNTGTQLSLCKEKSKEDDAAAGTNDGSAEKVNILTERKTNLQDSKKAFKESFFSDTENPEITIPGMSITTPDRPIDSPRYTSFQGIGGSEIRLIYPNLFKVETFENSGNVLRLKKNTIEKKEFKTAIENYLKNKVAEYNSILEKEKTKVRPFNQHYEKLKNIDPLATPSLDSSVRPYKLFTYEEFLNAIGGEKMLNTLAQLLYYQNLSIDTRKTSDDILTDIKYTKNAINLNKKISYITKNYLSQKNDQFIKENRDAIDDLIIPNYATSGYEVGVINSNFNDIISTKTSEILENTEEIQSQKQSVESNSDAESEAMIIGNGNKEENECGFDYNEALLIFDISQGKSPRLEGFKCWLKETLKKPAELKIVRPQHNLWETMGVFEDQNFEKGFAKENNLIQELEKDRIGGTIIEDLQINTPRKLPLEIHKETEKPKMQFQALRPEAEEIILNIRSTGENCLLIDNINTCSRPAKKILKPQNTSAELLLETTKKTTGIFNAKFEVCDKNQSKCGLKNYLFSTTPGQIKNLEIDLGENKKIAAGVYTLIPIRAFDQFRNEVHYSITPYILQVDKGGFVIGGQLQKTVEINDFKNTTIIYQAPIGTRGNANFSMYEKKDKQKLLSKNSANIFPAQIEVYHKGQKTKSITHKLTPEPIKIKNHGTENINEKRVPKIEIILKDDNNKLLDIKVKAQIHIKNKLLKSAILKEKSDLQFTSSLTIEKGKADLYLLPTNIAGEEEIKILIPGLDPYIIKTKILAGPLHTLALTMDENLKSVGETTVGKVSFTDQRGNILLWLNRGWSYFKITPEKKELLDFDVTNGRGEIRHTMGKNDHTLIFEIPFTRGNENLIEQETIRLRENFLDAAVQSGLNIMYLNYFGNDRGNQRGYLSKNNGYGEEIIKKSDKTLAITTQLVDLKKIKKPSILLTPEAIENHEQKQIFAQIDHKNQLNLRIPGIGKINITDPILESITLTQENSNPEASLTKREKASIIIYDLDENLTYTKRKLFNKNNPEKALASWSDGLSLEITNETIKNTPVRNLLWNGKSIGKALLTKINFTKAKADVENKNYTFETAFYKGSTQKRALGFFNQLSSLQDEYQGYDSIQNSDEMGKFIGFRGNFKNISSFAAGMSVGEATVPFGSEFLINLGDPALTRLDANENIKNADFNGGLGTTVYANPNKNIFKVKDIDFNSDGLLDLIVVDKNGTISLQKQNPDHTFQNLEDLMISAEEIEEIFVGDVDGNKDQDIIIKNKKNQIRAYLNTKGEFDVDGQIACLNTNASQNQISPHPESQNLYQFFMEDMNRDGKIDMITYDLHGDVKIFYGEGGRNNHSYLSKEVTKCDPDRYKRQQNNINLVTNLGIQVKPQTIKDNSLIRRAGLRTPNLEELKKSALNGSSAYFPASSLKENTLDHLSSINHNFNPQDLANSAIKTTQKYVINPFEKAVIMDGLPQTQQAYIPIDQLEKGIDPVEISKIYRDINGGSLIPNDDLQVTIQIKANKKIEKAAFFDRIQGPREINLDKEGKPENFQFLKGKANFNTQIGDAIYYLSDIDLQEGEILTWSYKIRYPGNSKNPPNKIEILDEDILDYQYLPKIKKIIGKDGMDADNLPDIGILPTNACVKSKNVAFNRRKSNKKTYSIKSINLQELVDAHNEDVEAEKLKAQKENEEKLKNAQNGEVENIPGLDAVKEKVAEKGFLSKILKEAVEDGAFDLGQIANLEKLMGEEAGEALNEMENEIKKLANATCNGFSLGSKTKSCKGLPVPFNQAFLAPGDYHIMGCYPIEPLTRTLGKGLPIFHFPGTLPTPFGPIPFPRGQKGPGDDFLRIGGGQYPSMIRIYAAPTLTAQLGLAICLGPQSIGNNIPSPLADIGGNCIVTSMALPCGGENEEKKSDEPEEQELRTQKFKDLGSCTNTSNIFPIPTDEAPLIKLNNGQPAPVHQEISIPAIRIGGVKNSNNTILGGNAKGIKKIVGGFLYNQIEYLKNNLLRWHLNIYLPDFEKLNKEIGGLTETFKNSKNIKIKGNSANLAKNPFTNKIEKEQIQEFGFSQDGNPFLQLKKLFNQSELINISTQNIPINIPRIYGEDIETYKNYLITRGESQAQIIKTRENEISAIIGSCPAKIAKFKAEGKKEELQKALQECQKAQNISQQLIKVNKKFDKLRDQIERNIETLQLYKKFPFEVYEWLHAADKYMAEIAGVINNFFGYLNFWLDINASRLSQYVDAITTILAVVKSYQILIDITANRSSKCGTCTNDTYDQYTCKLGFLCDGIKIDPIPIPKIKIPSLNIDLSHLDARLNIVLPNFQFNPKSIDLPRLANLPLPPKVGLNIDRDFEVPTLPQLPEPPALPELPSILPQVKLKLPILPPAPKIPELPKSITGTLKIIEKIGKIYCIIKQGFGLVGEKSVKAKIEQITQRTYDVPRVDHLNLMGELQLSLGKNNLQGLDYGIESHVQLQYNFDQFYAFIKGITNEINKATDNATNFADQTSNLISDKFETLENSQQNLVDSTQEFLNIDLKADLTYLSTQNFNAHLSSHENSTHKKELIQQIQKAVPQLHSQTDQEKLKSILSLLQQSTKVEKDLSKVNKIKNQISNLLVEKQEQNLQLAQLAKKDYKEFLLALAPHNQNNKKLQLSYNANFFKTDKTLETILNKNNIRDLYIQTQEGEIDAYLNALEKHSPDQLNMSPHIYQKNKNYLKNIKKEIYKYQLVKSSKKSGSTPLLTQNGETQNKLLYAQTQYTPDYTGEIKNAQQQTPAPKPDQTPDYSHYVKGVLIKTKDKKSLINVVNSQHNYEQYLDHYQKDMNKDGKADLILRDQNTIYIKYANDAIPKQKGGSGKYYYMALSLKNKKQKYEKAGGSLFKVYDENPEVKNFTLKGQNFDTLSFSRENNQYTKQNGYLMRIANHIENHYHKKNADHEKYALFLPKDTPITGFNLQIGDEKQEISKRIKSEILYPIKRYNPEKEVIDLGLSEIPRKRQYTQISSVELQGNTYIKNAPRSNQELGGKQIISDTEPPVPTIRLLRTKKNNEIQDQGNQLQGRVGTYYDLEIEREDNVQVEQVSLKQGEKTLISTTIGKPKGTIRLPNLFFTKEQELNYQIEGNDSEGNKTKETISLQIKIPKIEISDISRLSGRAEGIKNPIMITSELEQEIDQGTVTFERQRNEVTKEISAIQKGKSIKDFSVSIDQKQITGAYYDFGDLIGLYSKTNEQYGTLNAENGELKINKKFADKLQISVHFAKHYPIVQINENGEKRFDIILKAKELIKTTALQGHFTPLKGKKFGTFNEGQALIIEGKTMLFISKTGALSTNQTDLVAEYHYNPERETVTYKIKEHHFGKAIAEVEFKTLPL